MNNIKFFEEKFDINDEKLQKFNQYFELIKEYNKNMNLTGIDDEFGVYLKHFYDSLLIEEFIKKSDIKIADLGSGAGIPGIVLAIYYPEKIFYLIEPLKKRCIFLNIVKDKLSLNNVVILNNRAEELEKEKYDVVIARAVAKLSILLELALPLVKVGGHFIALKGSKGILELKESEKALKELNAKIIEIDKAELPFEKSLRINIYIEKNKNTPFKYPRNFGQIKKKPL